MKQALSFLQAASAIAFLLLGVFTAISWLRRRDRALGFLALAIVLLTLVIFLSRFPELSLLAFMGCGYALLRLRASLVGLSRRWHVAAVVAMAGGLGAFLLAQLLVSTGAAPAGLVLVATVAAILVWAAAVGESIVRFWIVARHLPAVQAWRLRSLSLGFAGLVAIILFAIAASAFTSSPAVQVLIQLVVLGIVPLLYVSFAPPAWLRRQWRATEEERLRKVMQDLLVFEGDRETLIERGLDGAARIVGASAAVAVDSSGNPLVSRGVDRTALGAAGNALSNLRPGVGTLVLGGWRRATLTYPLSVTGERADRLVLIAGSFSPTFGADEDRRAHQFVAALATAFDRRNVIEHLKTTNVELRAANEHKSAFLANMSHELRTPLNAILGFSELLGDDATGRYDSTTQRRFLEQIHSSGRHLLGLINDILDLSKVEAGQMEINRENLAVTESVQLVTDTIEPLAKAKRIVLDSEVDPELRVPADAAKLKQMLLNLVSNAIKFTPEGGRVTIRARALAPWVEIEVSDTGIGIASADLGRLFVEFQQLDAGPGRQHEGTGLGLALTKRFAELHGGTIEVESAQGKGSTFILRLPAEAELGKVRPSPEPQHVVSSDPNRPLVLVVDDNAEAAELLVRHLDAGGFRTEIARTGPEALDMARELRPVAITLDILMPGIDGWDVLTQLKGGKATANIPVVVVTVVDNPALGRALGALDYFVKPVDRSTLLSRLDRYTFTTRVRTEETRVLVVDDEPANLDLLQALLEPAGFTVLRATGGREGIDLAETQDPHLVLLDLMMPDVSGFDVVEALRSDPATQSIPIMVLTSKDLTDKDKRALNGRVEAILQRNSVAGEDLVEWLRRLVSNRRSG